MDFLKANLSSIAVQLSDNFSEIWSSTCTILFRDEIAILHVFDEDKIAITSLLRRPFPVQASIQLPCFSIEYSRLTARSCQHFFDILILFCGEDYCSVSWNSHIGDYQNLVISYGRILFDWQVNILIQMEWFVRRHSDYSKRPPVHAGGFLLLPSQSPRCFSIPARLYYFACSTKTMMPCSW